MQCIKCDKPLPDDALFCPYCGKKQSATARPGRRRANGEGSVYRYRAGWRAQVVVGYRNIGGKSRPLYKTKAGFKTKREATEYLATLKGDKRTRKVPTLQALWEEYEQGDYTTLSASRQEKYRIAWPRLADLHRCEIDMLTTADLQETVRSQTSTYYPARDMRDLLSLLYQIALANRFVTVNLAEYITLPPKNEKAQDAFTPQEITALWEDYAAGNWWTGYVLLMIYTGMMPGELLALRKECIDLPGRAIRKAGLKTKTRKEKPIILADEIAPVVSELMERTPGDKLLRINKDSFYTVYYETLERAGVRRLVPYSCRHTAATVLADAAIPPSMIQAIMRHASFQTTQRYIHESAETQLAAANAAAATIAKTRCENAAETPPEGDKNAADSPQEPRRNNT